MKIKITSDIFNRIQEIYKEYDRGEIEDNDAVNDIIDCVKDIKILNKIFSNIRKEWSDWASNDALISIMDVVDTETEVPGYDYVTTPSYDTILVKKI